MPRFHKRLALLATIALLAPIFSLDCALAAEPEQTVPQGEDPPGNENSSTLSPPLTEHNGVIVPPDIGDEGIHADVPNPEAGHDKEVIPPPGTEGSAPDALPR